MGTPRTLTATNTYKALVQKLKESDHLKSPYVNWRTILKRVSNMMGKIWLGLSVSWYGPKVQSRKQAINLTGMFLVTDYKLQEEYTCTFHGKDCNETPSRPKFHI